MATIEQTDQKKQTGVHAPQFWHRSPLLTSVYQPLGGGFVLLVCRVVEVKGNQENAHEDPFIQEEKEKKKRVKKQKLNEMRNMASVSKAEEKKKGTCAD